MGHTAKISPDPQAILAAWIPLKDALGTTIIRSAADYKRVAATVDALLDEMGDNERHPLAEIVDYLSDRMKTYEDDKFAIPDAAPHQILRFLMDQHDLKQDDLADCAPQSRISDFLAKRRSISKATAKKLAKRFKVHADLFL